MQSPLRALLPRVSAGLVLLALSVGSFHAQQSAPLGLFERKESAKQKELQNAVVGCWTLMQFESRNVNIQRGSVSCFVTFQDGYSTIWWSARVRSMNFLGEEELTPVIQAEVRRYRVSEELNLQMIATQKVDNISGELTINANREPIEYTLELDELSGEMVLNRINGTRMTFRRMSEVKFPQSSLDLLERAVGDNNNLRRPKQPVDEPAKKPDELADEIEPIVVSPRELLAKELIGCWTQTEFFTRDASMDRKSVRSFLTFQDGYSTVWWAGQRFQNKSLGSNTTTLVQAEARLYQVSDFLTLQMSPLRTLDNLSGELSINGSRRPTEYTIEFDEVTKNLVLSRIDGTRMTYRKVISNEFPEIAIDRLNETRGGRVPMPPGSRTRRR